MNINFVKQRKDADSIPLNNETFLAGRIGFWANVKEVDSTRNFVTVVSDTGMIYSGISVISKEWVYENEDESYIGCSINLPPVGARVFVLCPTHTITGAFVLCSGYAQGETNKQVFFSDKENKEKDNLIEKSVNTSGWKKTEYYKNGNYIFESHDENIHIEITPKADDDESLEKRIYLKAWDNEIIINEDGISFKDCKGNVINSTEDGIEITDTNNNDFTLNTDGVIIEDTNKNKIEMASKGMKLTDTNGCTYESTSSAVTINGKLKVNK